MIVSIYRGQNEYYTGIFFGKGPMDDLYTAAWVFGDKVAKRETIRRDEVSKWISTARACRPIKDAFGDDSWTVELHRSPAGCLTVKV